MDMQATTLLEETAEVKSKMAHGFGVLIVREFILKILAFGGQLILARLLAPEDFGMYAMIIFLITLFSLFSDIGLSPAIIQRKKNLSQHELSTVFAIKICISIVLIVLLNVLTPLFQMLYPSLQDIHIWMLRILSLTLLFTSFRSLPVALIERDLHYNKISTIDITGIGTYYIITVACALQGWGVWSFISGVVMKELVEVFVAFYYRPYSPDFHFKFKEVKDMVKFGAFIQAGGITNFLYTAMVPVVGGIKGGPYAVGLLDWGSNIVAVPESITNNFSRVAFSGFARLQGGKEVLSKAIAKSVSLLMIITMFFTVLIFGFAQEGVRLVFTDKWLGGIPALYWFAAGIPLYAVFASYGQGILTLGKSKAVFFSMLFANSTGLAVAFVLVQYLGFISVAIASTLALVILFICYIFIARSVNLSINLLQIVIPKIGISIVTFIYILLLNAAIHQGIIMFILKVVSATMMYGLLLFIFAKDEMYTMLSIITKKIYRN
jgi:O-antigen/teichoic acid export membrane protein